MSATGTSLSVSAAELRREFDRSFAAAPVFETPRVENILLVRIATDAYAIRLTEIAGLYADRRVVALPTPLPELLGSAGFRGQIAPVYDLAALLGYPLRPGRGVPRWLVLARWREPVALAFEAFEAQLTVLPERILAAAGAGQSARPHVRGALHTDSAVHPLLHLPSVLEDIHKRVGASHPTTKLAQER